MKKKTKEKTYTVVFVPYWRTRPCELKFNTRSCLIAIHDHVHHITRHDHVKNIPTTVPFSRSSHARALNLTRSCGRPHAYLNNSSGAEFLSFIPFFHYEFGRTQRATRSLFWTKREEKKLVSTFVHPHITSNLFRCNSRLRKTCFWLFGSVFGYLLASSWAKYF